MSSYKKQHIIPKTYLRHFSSNSDGIGLFVIDSEDKHRLGIQKRNSGDKIFWINNYSDSDYFTNVKTIEKFFATEIEQNYNSIISIIKKENGKLEFSIKQELLKWIFYTKMRSPIWYNHLENFTDQIFFEKSLHQFIEYGVNMRWTILKSPKDAYWWTSDNPGYCLNIKEYESSGQIFPLPIYEFGGVDMLLYYPLSKEYCLNIHAFNKGEDLNLNITNTDVNFENADFESSKLINYYTLITQKRLIISSEIKSLREVEKLKIKQRI